MTLKELCKRNNRAYPLDNDVVYNIEDEGIDAVLDFVKAMIMNNPNDFYGLRIEPNGKDMVVELDVCDFTNEGDMSDAAYMADAISFTPHEGYMTVTATFRDTFDEDEIE